MDVSQLRCLKGTLFPIPKGQLSGHPSQGAACRADMLRQTKTDTIKS